MAAETRFDPRKEFFVIDSDHLDEVRASFYGYTIQEDGIWEKETLPKGKKMDRNGIGAYILIEKNNGIISIYQDYLGSYGLYLYRNKEYFAISNSFLRLEEYLIEHGAELTINQDFANHMVVSDLCTVAYPSTLVNEIVILERDAVVTIDCDKRAFAVELTPRYENTIEIASEEGIAVLDRWHEKWAAIIRALNTDAPLMFDLTGGFDTRVSFLLALTSGIDLRNAYIFSTTDGLHTHKEDLAIAQAICDHYGLVLNRNVYSDDGNDHSLEDIINLSFYTRMPFHNQMHFKHRRYRERRFRINGNGGEMLRGYQFMSPESFSNTYKNRANRRYTENTAEEINRSIDIIMKEAFDAVAARYGITEKESKWIPQHMYRETRARNHFGKFQVEEYYSNVIAVSPLLDPDLARLKFLDEKCEDPNLLITVILQRFCKELLQFKIDSGRKFQQSTISYAEEINRKYPRKDENNLPFTLLKSEASKEREDERFTIPFSVSLNERNQFLVDVYQSRVTRKIIKSVYSTDVYYHSYLYLKTESYFPMQELFPIISTAKVLYDIQHGKNDRQTAYETCLQLKDSEGPKDDSFAVMDWMISDYVELKAGIKRAKKKQNAAEKELKKLKGSRSYRIGRKITYLPRKVKELLS